MIFLKEFLKLVVTYVVADSVSDATKLRVVTTAISLLPDGSEKQLLERIAQWNSHSGSWPNLEFLVEQCGYSEGLSGEIVPDINPAHLAAIFEREADKERKLSIAEHLMETSKKISSMSEEAIMKALDQAHMMVGDGTTVKREELTASQTYKRRKQEPAGILTFIKPIDERVLGVTKGTMMTLAGFAGQFKTTGAHSILYKNVIDCKLNGVYFSMEMPKDVLKFYQIARHSYNDKFSGKFEPIAKDKMIHSMLTDKEEKAMELIEEDLHSSEYGNMLILDRTDFKSLTFGGIRSRLARVPFDIDFWIVDYIQLFRYIKEAAGMKEPANQYTDFFMTLTIELCGRPTSGLVLSQTNREGYKLAKEKEGEYDLTALAEVNALERDSSDVVFFYSDENLKDSNELLVNLPKCRFGDPIFKPVTTYINPALCVVGEEVQGMGGNASNLDMSSFLTGDSQSLFG